MSIASKKIIAISVVLTLVFFSACSQCKDIPLRSAADVRGMMVDPEKVYEVKFTSGEKYSVRGNDLQARNDMIGIRFDPRDDYRFYSYEQFESICVREKGGGVGTALIIGGIIGGVLILTPLIYIAVAGIPD